MTREKKNWLKFIFGLALLVVGLGIGGHYDYLDAVRTEMLNNGAYARLEAAHPDASEDELIRLYLAEEEK